MRPVPKTVLAPRRGASCVGGLDPVVFARLRRAATDRLLSVMPAASRGDRFSSHRQTSATVEIRACNITAFESVAFKPSPSYPLMG
jgi:hypothetical protein